MTHLDFVFFLSHFGISLGVPDSSTHFFSHIGSRGLGYFLPISLASHFFFFFFSKTKSFFFFTLFFSLSNSTHNGSLKKEVFFLTFCQSTPNVSLFSWYHCLGLLIRASFLFSLVFQSLCLLDTTLCALWILLDKSYKTFSFNLKEKYHVKVIMGSMMYHFFVSTVYCPYTKKEWSNPLRRRYLFIAVKDWN